jgi:aliphatic sulfonates family ABC transporter substrate-binding protein
MPVLELSGDCVPSFRARALVFEDPASRALLKRIERLAPTEATVLITGETGVGKEIVARHVHDRSARSGGPFVAVNCGALTPSLLESELFGHEKGAFTGALASKAGWFEAATSGTLFLDEVGDLPLAAQVKLLRVLQEREVVRVGSRRPTSIDVRVIAATNVDLEAAVADGAFREDLFYRLHVALLPVAPLRERPRDVLPLARHFLIGCARRLGLEPPALAPDAAERLLAHHWPGNIRELENAIYQAALVACDGVVTADDLPLSTRGSLRASTAPPPATPPASPTRGAGARAALEQALAALFEEERPCLQQEIEEIIYRTAYAASDQNQLRTARLLGVSRNVVRARLLQHGLLQPSPRPSSASDPPEALTVAAARRAGQTRAVRIGHQPLGVLSVVRATRALEDALGARGMEVVWVEYATGMQLVDALSAGALDFGVAGEAAPVFAQAVGDAVVYLAAEPPAPRSEAIVVHDASPLRTLADLRGKTLAMTRGANVVYFVARALEEVGLGMADVHVRMLAPQAALAAFAQGDVEAWAIWDPHLASLQQSSPTRVLRDARGLADNRAFYVARRAFVDEHPDVAETFVRQVGATGRWANQSPSAVARLLAPHVGLTEAALEATLARAPFDSQPLGDAALRSQRRVAETLHRLQFIAQPVDVWRAVWTPPPARRSA